jgi:hypothetical protein
MKIIIPLFAILLSSCAQESKIDPLFEAIPLRTSHGDGEYSVFTIKLPLSDQSIESYASPIDPRTGVARVPLLGDMLRLMTQATFNLGAGLGMGQTNLVIKQPIPDLDSPYLKSISVKRVFFHIDQTDLLAGARRVSLFQRFRNLIRGGTVLDFSFIRTLKIHMKMEKGEAEPESYMPEIIEGGSLSSASKADGSVIEFLNYSRKKRSEVLRNKERGTMYVFYSQNPVQVRSFLRRDPELAELIKEIIIVNNSLVVQLKEGELMNERMFSLLERNETDLATMGITKIDPCSELTCMDVKVNEENLLPLLLKGNKLNIETMVDASRVPPTSFQLKGFIEFEIKLDLPL